MTKMYKYNLIIILLYIISILFINVHTKSINNIFKRKESRTIYHSFPLDQCIRCDSDDLKKEVSYCKETGYKQLVQWSSEEVILKSNEIIENYKLHPEDIIVPIDKKISEDNLPKYRACYHQKHGDDIKNFIKFQISTLFFGIASFIVTVYRKKKNIKQQYLNILRLIGK